jgi:large subunit ribosomal protein L4
VSQSQKSKSKVRKTSKSQRKKRKQLQKIKKLKKRPAHLIHLKRRQKKIPQAKTAKKSAAVKKEKSQVVKKTLTTKKTSVEVKPKGISLPVIDVTGKSLGTVTLKKEIFGVEPNMNLLAQAFRIYFARLTPKTGSVKTRAEVRGGGKKPWRQKGTGRARAGSIRSPLWVGGGITFGPKPRKSSLVLPQKMRHKALVSALSLAQKEGSIHVIADFEKMPPKTNEAAMLFKKLSISGRILLVLEKPHSNVNLAIRNIQNVETDLVDNLNAYKVLISRNLLLSKSAIEKLKA